MYRVSKIRRSPWPLKRRRRSREALPATLLAFNVTSKFADYLPLYRLEDIFARQGFEISWAAQSVWCGDVADVVEPLYERMAERFKKSHVVATDDTVLPLLSPGQTELARMWVCVGDETNPPQRIRLHPETQSRRAKGISEDYTQVLLADAYGGYTGVVAGNAITRAGCWSHARRKFVEAKTGDRARGGRADRRTVCGGTTGQRHFR
jgi:transposase